MRDAGLQEPPLPRLVRDDGAALASGARNLLEGCAELRPRQRVLILREDPALGWFDEAAPLAVAAVARQLGALVDVLVVGGPHTDLPPEFADLQRTADVEIWFARIGDQDRFRARDPNRVCVASYARTALALASAYGTRPHTQMLDLKRAVDERLGMAREFAITCSRGTRLHGTHAASEAEDVTVRRFPMCVPRPVPASGFSGKVALTGYLTPTGSRSYQPASLLLTGTVFAIVDSGRIVHFEGTHDVVRQIKSHYARVADLFSIEAYAVHSWHAGIHDGCSYEGTPDDNPDLWSNTVFGSPRWLHFHTCGDYAPGEICWMVENPTITADGARVWGDGKLLI